ncbi:MAG TPA: enoyl-CoA hydratase-related protein [Burkholderiales bacterium]|nr:enoyl-CoA hydratase-related protein [Burkholderiales bacterium]
MSVVLFETPSDGVALLRINRPERRNALNMEVRQLLVRHLDELAEDADIRCAVLTGDARAFAAGADIGEMADLGAIELLERQVGRLWDAIAAFPKPLIAAVNGYALGGGCELAMHADIIIAGESARFGLPEVRLGILPGGGGTQRLIRAVGKFKALRMILTGDPVSGAEAFAMGLASEVVADGNVESRALEMATQIAALPPLAVMQIKEVVLRGQDADLATGLALERKALQILFSSEDKREGMHAFMEKRKPNFVGR